MAVEIISELKQKGGQQFALIDANNIRGGFYQVEQLSDRDNIPEMRRKNGMFCFVENDPNKIYTYQLLNGVWVSATLGGGGNANIVVLEEEEYLAIENPIPDIMYFIYEPVAYVYLIKPTNKTFVFDGTVKSLPSNDGYTVDGVAGSSVGTYIFIVSLKFGYRWSDGSQNDILVIYTITEPPVTTDWVFGNSFPIQFNGSPITTLWSFGGAFPVQFTSTEDNTDWQFGQDFPLLFNL